MPITGTHALLYTSEPEALRACLRDVFGWDHVDAHDGWLIFALPPAELGVHPADAPAHELTFMCDDIEATMAELQAKGIEFKGKPESQGFGIVVTMVLPGRRRRDALPAAPRHRDLSRYSRAALLCTARVSFSPPRTMTPTTEDPGEVPCNVVVVCSHLLPSGSARC